MGDCWAVWGTYSWGTAGLCGGHTHGGLLGCVGDILMGDCWAVWGTYSLGEVCYGVIYVDMK